MTEPAPAEDDREVAVLPQICLRLLKQSEVRTLLHERQVSLEPVHLGLPDYRISVTH